ncbi:MAG: hypothetical protein H7144_05795 [Burkholderiales bacterium]|nr:hypothetical protein [Phycisphaerae bacterium]
MLIAALTCLGAAAQLIWLAVEGRQVAPPMIMGAQIVLAAGLGVLSIKFLRRASTYRAQAETTHLAEPTAKPDFSTLRNGSQLAERLTDMVSTKTSDDPSPD